MSPEELHRHSKSIDESVRWIQKRTDDIWNRFELIDDCYSDECDKERSRLSKDMDSYLDKLQTEEKMIDGYEEILHNKTGIR
tara:strand:- start:326 stop:571 length:246 start_codon:yes stop_codon:yes gene_type:complete